MRNYVVYAPSSPTPRFSSSSAERAHAWAAGRCGEHARLAVYDRENPTERTVYRPGAEPIVERWLDGEWKP